MMGRLLLSEEHQKLLLSLGAFVGRSSVEIEWYQRAPTGRQPSGSLDENSLIHTCFELGLIDNRASQCRRRFELLLKKTPSFSKGKLQKRQEHLRLRQRHRLPELSKRLTITEIQAALCSLLGEDTHNNGNMSGLVNTVNRTERGEGRGLQRIGGDSVERRRKSTPRSSNRELSHVKEGDNILSTSTINSTNGSVTGETTSSARHMGNEFRTEESMDSCRLSPDLAAGFHSSALKTAEKPLISVSTYGILQRPAPVDFPSKPSKRTSSRVEVGRVDIIDSDVDELSIGHYI